MTADTRSIVEALACGAPGCPCQAAARKGQGKTHCPAHADGSPSLNITERDGKTLAHCFAGCDQAAVLDALRERGLWSARGEGAGIPPGTPAHTHTPAGCTLEQYADAKGVPVDFLRSLGLSTISFQSAPAVRVLYFDQHGNEAAIRFRVALSKGAAGDNRFRWKSGSKAMLYGLWRLDQARTAGRVTLVEGESDSHTLWLHDEPAIGVPGASAWRDEWAPLFDGIPVVNLVVEPDQGGEGLRSKLVGSPLRDRVRLVRLGDHKDASGLYLADRERFQERWAAALAAAVPLVDELQADADARQAEAWQACAALARELAILNHVAAAVRAAGVVGEERTIKLLYLALTSRVLEQPVSCVVKGPSSAGKSFTVGQVLALFPPDAVHCLSSMSERALAYSEEPLRHRFLVLYEAAGLRSDFASYLIRSLLSEGRVRYETVEKTRDGLKPRLIEREGPTGLLVTTTEVQLHPENETRLLSLPVTDTQEQTRHIFRALAGERTQTIEPAYSRETWHALQVWLAGADHDVAIPYALALVEHIPAVAVRLRRDVGALLNLIRAHAVLHQASRGRDDQGRIIATIEDYAVVRELVIDLMADGVGATVSAAVRETVAAVAALVEGSAAGETTMPAVAKALGLDRSAAYRRAQVAIDKGYLRNLEDKPRKPARLALGEPLPEETMLLPPPECVQVCTCDNKDTPPSPPDCPSCDQPVDEQGCCWDCNERLCQVCGGPTHSALRSVCWLCVVKQGGHAADD